ncbi:MAG TPA: nuclear transport factor 2 family protein [Rugosimonospora sp.]|jgi:hypothetical protein
MTLTAEDRTAITDLICLHGHLVDAGEHDRMHELFTEDVTYDLTGVGGAVITGLAALRHGALAMGDANPVGHHVTNIVLGEPACRTGDEVCVRSKGIGVKADGTVGSVTYEDTVVRGGQGWRISHRRILARRTPPRTG